MEDRRLEATARLLDVMTTLRRECPWDREQTFDSLRSNTIEETYELADAITDHNMEGIKEELGDLLLHVVFYSKLGEEAGAFDYADVANALCDKLVYRHPHVYGDIHANTPDQVKENWEALKLRKKNRKSGTLGGVPRSLPALVKALRVGEKAAATGFDWQKREDVWDKVKEETAEVEAEMRQGEPRSRVRRLVLCAGQRCAALRRRSRICVGAYEQEVHPPLQLHGGTGCRTREFAARPFARRDGGPVAGSQKRRIKDCLPAALSMSGAPPYGGGACREIYM